MTASIRKSTRSRQKSTVLERSYSAPRELLFRLFTDPAHLTRWWVPYALTNPVCEFDARPGGAIRFVMQAPDGTRFTFIGTVHEVDPPQRLVFTTIALDQAGDPHLDVLQTITFTENDGKTVVRVQIDVVTGTTLGIETLSGMEGGWMQDFGRLEFYLLSQGVDERRRRAIEADETSLLVTMPSDREVMMTRTFDAPRAEVFKALINPATRPIWWKSHAPQDAPIESSGEYLPVAPQELVVNEFDLAPRPGYPGLDAVHLHDLGNRTRLTGVSLFPTREQRDDALLNGIVRDAIETYDRLAASLTTAS